ncbi:Coatomer subunit beta-1 [Senna tora]|uniref:Coatomer subunit beta-1 n=1 Tax=Senna tora TaxID=362788 RepID=A0A834WC92_9FABA|nr:Coatomer subunit beta-1 [Senna tora]
MHQNGKDIIFTSSNASNISILGWWIVQTTVRPVSTVFLTVLITIAAALASRPEVGSSMNIIDGFATSSTAIVSLLRCSVESPVSPGNPTSASLNELSSTSSITSSTNIYVS